MALGWGPGYTTPCAETVGERCLTVLVGPLVLINDVSLICPLPSPADFHKLEEGNEGDSVTPPPQGDLLD